MDQLTQYEAAGLLLGACFLGIGVALLLAQERTRVNVPLALIFLDIGAITALINLAIADAADGHPGWLAYLEGILEAGVVLLSAIYMHSLLSISQATPRAAAVVRLVIRFATVCAAGLVLASCLWPTERLLQFTFSALDDGALGDADFWRFAAFYVIVTVAFIVGWFTLATHRIDPAERDRAAAYAVNSGLLVLTLLMPRDVSLWLIVVSMTIAVWSQVRVTAAQARRSVFLSRFLSPRVTELVQERGIASVMQPHQAELTVVAADLRNFTPYAEGVPSQAVVDLLTEYYDVTGEVVARHGGTITDYAGDGILILVGAPLPREDHADVALALARELHVAMQPVLDRWATKIHPLGLGIGVASGTVTVGTIGTSERMEYTAIGTAVNLAARLCSAAGAGEVLVNEDAARLGTTPVVEHSVMPLKGLTGEQVVFALDDPADPAQVTRGSTTLSTEPGSTTS